jgi:hypothetical protein
VSHIAGAIHIQVSAASLLGPAHLLGLAAAALVGLRAFYRLPTIGVLRAVKVSFLAIVLLGPTLQPWYLVWGIVILAVGDGARVTSAIIILSVSVSFLGVVGLGLLTSELASLGPVLLPLLFDAIVASAIASVDVFAPTRTLAPVAAGITTVAPWPHHSDQGRTYQ